MPSLKQLGNQAEVITGNFNSDETKRTKWAREIIFSLKKEMWGGSGRFINDVSVRISVSNTSALQEEAHLTGFSSWVGISHFRDNFQIPTFFSAELVKLLSHHFAQSISIFTPLPLTFSKHNQWDNYWWFLGHKRWAVKEESDGGKTHPLCLNVTQTQH